MPAWTRTVLAGPSQPATKPKIVSSTLGPRPQNRPRAPGSVAYLEQLGAALDLNPTVGQGRRRVGQDLRPRQQLVTAQPGQHDVVDRTRHRHQREHPPQGARIGLGSLEAIPLIQPPVTATLVVGQPQLRDQAWEAGKQRRVEQAFPAEHGVPPGGAAGGEQAQRLCL
jgi:hypothetical protein